MVYCFLSLLTQMKVSASDSNLLSLLSMEEATGIAFLVKNRRSILAVWNYSYKFCSHPMQKRSMNF